MGAQEDKEKAEKLAAAKKRVAQLKKKKAGAATTSTDKPATSSTTPARTEPLTAIDAVDTETSGQPDSEIITSVQQDIEDNEEETTRSESRPRVVASEQGADAAAFNEAIAASNLSSEGDTAANTEPEIPIESASTTQRHQGRQSSISMQSKLRSTSFRQSIPTSPSQTSDNISDGSLYRKHASRIEELERDNERLIKAADDNETRWRKSEEELEELHEKIAQGETGNTEIAKLQSEIDVLRRNSRTSSSKSTANSKESATTSAAGDLDQMRKELETKDSIIGDLQVELSRLRTQVSAQTQGCETHGEQIAALQANATRAEVAVKRLEIELIDSRKALTRASEKAVADGTEKSSSQTRMNALQKEHADLQLSEQESMQTIDGLEKKIEAMTKIHRENEQRNNTRLANLDTQLLELGQLKSKADSLERENMRLREARKQTISGEGGDDGLDELEDEDRKRLERRVRELESEVFDLRRGVWRDRRRELQPGMVEDAGEDFDDVDLSGSGPVSRRRSTASQGPSRQHSGFTQVLNSGLAAFRSSTISPDSQQKTRPRNDSLLQDFDDDEFDEHEFARLQREEEMKKMVEHVREVKRGLKKWAGWRLDLVDARRGGGGWGVGEVFDI